MRSRRSKKVCPESVEGFNRYAPFKTFKATIGAEVRSKRASRSIAALRSNRLKELTPGLPVSKILGFAEASQFQRAHREWVTEALMRELAERDGRWSEAVTVGSLAFVEKLRENSESKPRIVRPRRWTGRSRYGNRVKLTRVFLPAKMMC